MRRWIRPTPPARLARFIETKQLEVDAGGDVNVLWTRARRTQSVRRLATLLASATGIRERCMYCEDSRGTDIEHFRPRASHRQFSFIWVNWLWACTGCNRAKGHRFPLDAHGEALLIDPTAENPWDSLHFDSTTGEITARWVGGAEEPKGKTTIELLSPLRGQAVSEGRMRTRRNLVRAVREFLRAPAANDADDAHIQDLIQAVVDNSGYGLDEWFFLRDGAEEDPFRDLCALCPRTWTRVIEHVRGRP